LRRLTAIGVIVVVILALAPITAGQTKTKPRPKKPSALPSENQLRIRLEFHPQDAAAHKQLVELLKNKNAFRALVAEEANWIKNNPTDYFALIELVNDCFWVIRMFGYEVSKSEEIDIRD